MYSPVLLPAAGWQPWDVPAEHQVRRCCSYQSHPISSSTPAQSAGCHSGCHAKQLAVGDWVLMPTAAIHLCTHMHAWSEPPVLHSQSTPLPLSGCTAEEGCNTFVLMVERTLEPCAPAHCCPPRHPPRCPWWTTQMQMPSSTPRLPRSEALCPSLAKPWPTPDEHGEIVAPFPGTSGPRSSSWHNAPLAGRHVAG